MGAIHGGEVVRLDRRPRAVPGRGLLRQILFRTRSHPAGSPGRARFPGWNRIGRRGHGDAPEGLFDHRSHALCHGYSDPLRRHVRLPCGLPFPVLRAGSDVPPDDAGHGGRLPAGRAPGRAGDRAPGHARWFPHAGVAIDRTGCAGGLVRVHRAAGCRTAWRGAVSAMVLPRRARRCRHGDHASRLGGRVLPTRTILPRQQGSDPDDDTPPVQRTLAGSHKDRAEPQGGRLVFQPFHGGACQRGVRVHVLLCRL